MIQNKNRFYLSSGSTGFIHPIVNYYHPQCKLQILPNYQFSILEQQQEQNYLAIEEEIAGKSFISQIISRPIAWCLLFVSIFLTAMISPSFFFNFQDKHDSLLINSWRFMFQAILLLPLMSYQFRQTPVSWKTFTSKFDLLLKEGFDMLIWYVFLKSSFYFVQVNHCLVLSDLMCFFISLFNSSKEKIHDVERGGMGMLIIGILLVILDSALKSWWNVIGDFLAICSSLSYAFLNYQSDRAYQVFPPIFTLFFVSLFSLLNYFIAGYFFALLQVSFDVNVGLLGLFTIQNFSEIFYTSIIIGIGMLIQRIVLPQLFEPVIIAIALVFQTIISICYFHLWLQEKLPSQWTSMGYILMLPGELLIILGQDINEKTKNFEEKKSIIENKITQIYKRLTQGVSTPQQKPFSFKNIS